MAAAGLGLAALLGASCGTGTGSKLGPDTTLAASASGVAAGQDLSTQPDVTVPEGERPAELRVTDLVVGSGETVKVGDTVKVQYVGVAWSTGQQFDASWDRGEPYEVYRVGTAEAGVIEGWQQGLIGARVGGRRQLIIPPDLGYGEAGAGGIIAPGETLIFVLDVVSTAHLEP